MFGPHVALVLASKTRHAVSAVVILRGSKSQKVLGGVSPESSEPNKLLGSDRPFHFNTSGFQNLSLLESLQSSTTSPLNPNTYGHPYCM